MDKAISKPVSAQPIPLDAKRIFKGKVFDVYQWEQEMFDGTTKTFEKIKRPDTVIVIAVTSDSKIILILEEQPGKRPFIGVAGGRAEENENPGEVARRELLEETGYQTDNLMFWFAIQPFSKIDWTEYIFIAKQCHKVKNPKLESGEKIAIQLVTFDEFVETALSEDFQEKELAMRIMRAKLNPKKMQELRDLMI